MRAARYNVPAPAVTGNEMFERYFLRVQMNTLEQLVVFIPSICPLWAVPESVRSGGSGRDFLIGRLIYFFAYVKDPKKREAGFVLSVCRQSILLVGAIFGAARAAMLLVAAPGGRCDRLFKRLPGQQTRPGEAVRGIEERHRHREQRNQDDQDGDDAEVLFDHRDVAEQVATPQEQRHPQNSAQQVVAQEFAVGHPTNTCDERRKGPDDGHEARECHCHAAVPLEEFLGAMQVFDLEQPVSAAECRGSYRAPDRIIERVAQNGSRRQQREEQRGIEGPARINRRQRTDGKQ